MNHILLRTCLLLVFVPFIFVEVNAQIITTYAGTGAAGYAGDNGPAIFAKLNQPGYICHDASENLLIADYKNNVIRKVTNTGSISTIAGNGTAGYSGDGGHATVAKVRGPMGIAVDGSGNIYFAEALNHVIRKISTSGIISTIAGTGTSGYNGDDIPATDAKLYSPYGVDVDNAGNIYFADVNNYRVRKINTLGIISTIAGNGFFGFSGDGSPATAAQTKYPSGIAVNNVTGDIYISDYANHRIRKVNALGIITTIAGTGVVGNSGDGGPATSANLNGPNGVYVDNVGNVYITCNYANVVRKVNISGIISTIAGNGTIGAGGDGGPATTAQLSNPNDISINAIGNIFIADADNNAIRKIANYPEAINEINCTGQTITIYPNPAKTEITIEAEGTVETISISNAIGQTIYRQSTATNNTVIDISGFASGMYFVKVNGVYGGKFVKE